MQQIGHGGFGEVYKGIARAFDKTEIPFALKRALPPNTPGADIEQHLRQQTRRLDSLQREARVYFSPTFNTGQCLHLALLHDVAQVRNSDGDDEVVDGAEGGAAQEDEASDVARSHSPPARDQMLHSRGSEVSSSAEDSCAPTLRPTSTSSRKKARR